MQQINTFFQFSFIFTIDSRRRVLNNFIVIFKFYRITKMWSVDQLIVQLNKNLSIQNALLFVLMLQLMRILWSRRYHYLVSWQLPGPVAYPIIGNLPTLLRNSIGRK